MKRLTTSDYYITSDLATACIVSMFYPLEAIDRADPYKAQFMFKREDGLDDLLKNYWSHNLKVDPLNFFMNLKTLKARLYEKR